jgi:hypothetical protein
VYEFILRHQKSVSSILFWVLLPFILWALAIAVYDSALIRVFIFNLKQRKAAHDDKP